MPISYPPNKLTKNKGLVGLLDFLRQRKIENEELERQRRFGPLQEELMRAEIASEGRRDMPKQRIPAEVIAEILKLRKGLTDKKAGIEAGGLDDQLLQSQLGNLLAELADMQGQEIYEETVPGEKKSLFGIDRLWPDTKPSARTRLRPKGSTKKIKSKVVDSHINPKTGKPRRVFSPKGKVVGSRGKGGAFVPSAREKLAEAGGLTESKPLPKKLDKATAQEILDEAGGDRNLARKIARERGYIF